MYTQKQLRLQTGTIKKYLTGLLFSAVILNTVSVTPLTHFSQKEIPLATNSQKIFLLGGFQGDSISYNDVWSFNSSSWSQSTSNAPWHSRAGFATAYFRGKVWIFGGIATPPLGGQYLDDYWSSSDGVHWTQASPHAPWGKRRYFDVLVFNNKLWIFAGTPDENGGVWSSPDGINWTKVLNTSPWPARDMATAFVYDGKMWLMGGMDYTVGVYMRDIWSSPDGINWTEVTQYAPWSNRIGAAATVFNGKMWLLGGLDEGTPPYGDLNDVWYSTNGLNWTQVTANAPWHPRNFFKTISYDGKLWILGGGYQASWSSRFNLNETWSSSDGVNWIQMANAPWQVRDSYGALTVPATFGRFIQNPN